MQELFLQCQVAATIETSYHVASLSNTFSLKDTIRIFYQQSSSKDLMSIFVILKSREKKPWLCYLVESTFFFLAVLNFTPASPKLKHFLLLTTILATQLPVLSKALQLNILMGSI